MARDLAAFRARMRRIPQAVQDEVRKQLEREAVKLVREMEVVKPIPEIEIGWTWGDAPAGSVTLARSSGGQAYGRIGITIYATATIEGGAFPAIARWFELGTKNRFTKAGAFRGRITASPYFFPVWRANRSRVRGNLTRAVTRGVRKA